MRTNSQTEFDFVDEPSSSNRTEEFVSSAPKGTLPNERKRTLKRIQITSVEAYERVLQTLPDRERLVLDGLVSYFEVYGGSTPTAYELFEFIEFRNNLFDINNVRPVLTRLKDKGLVAFCKQRKCGITGQTAYTWKLEPDTQPFLPLEWPK